VTENSLSPAFVRIFYSSVFGPHVQTIPTRAWTPPAGGFTHGSFLDWTNTARDAADMIADMVAAEADTMITDSVFTSYLIFTQASATDDPILVDGAALSVFGGDATPGWYKAVETTYSLLDTSGSKAKLVLLDSATQNTFDAVAVITDLTAAQQAVMTEFTSTGNGWSSRAGFRPSTFRRSTKTLNEKLRRAYRMA
jgi:hypothetical protein